MNLKQAYDEFLLNRETYCTDKTLSNYSNNLRYLLEFMEEEYKCSAAYIDVTDIDKSDLTKYVIFLRNKNSNDKNPYMPTSSKKVTNRTVRTYSIDMRTFFNYLDNEGYLTKNPMKGFRLIKSEKRTILPLTKDEVFIIDSCYSEYSKTGIRNKYTFCIFNPITSLTRSPQSSIK